MVRAKFQLTKISEVCWNAQAKELCFSAVYDDGIEEHRRFYDSTPSGELRMLINNPKALDYFKMGEYYYLDMTFAGPLPSENEEKK